MTMGAAIGATAAKRQTLSLRKQGSRAKRFASLQLALVFQDTAKTSALPLPPVVPSLFPVVDTCGSCVALSCVFCPSKVTP